MKTVTTNVRGGKKIKNFRLKKREDRVIQQILQIEALETRMLLSGVGTGLSKKKVVFLMPLATRSPSRSPKPARSRAT